MSKEKISRIKFYSLNKKSMDNIIDEINDSKLTKEYEVALNYIIKKDIKGLKSSLKKMINHINDGLLKCNILYDKKLSNKPDELDTIIEDINNIEKIVKRKLKKKPGFLSRNKALKKQKYNELTSLYAYILKSKTNLISLKDEYNKLKERSSITNKIEEEKEYISDESALERTINFYMSKEN